MKLLFVHQNFPGQYRHLAPHFAADPKNQVVSISEKHPERPIKFPRIRHIEYDKPKGASKDIHHYLFGFEAGIRRGQAVVRMAGGLRQQGFVPDVICAHPGWGEALYLKEVFPESKLIDYFEFYYRYRGSDVGFDPEFPTTFDDMFKTPTRNAVQLMSFAGCDWGVSPTTWQREQFPAPIRSFISVMHEGVDTKLLKPNPEALVKLEKAGIELTAKDEVITYVSRNLEPYRGFHVFMRALPEILRCRPNAHVLIVGGDDVSYGRRLPPGESYRQKLLAEVGKDFDVKRVHFLGKVPYPMFVRILQISSAHIYLTYPFVLSWSMLEAMALGCLVIGSRTPPVQEVIQDGVNGLLVDFFAVGKLAERVDEALTNRSDMQPLRQRARQTIIERYDLRSVCLPQHLALIEEWAARK